MKKLGALFVLLSLASVSAYAGGIFEPVQFTIIESPIWGSFRYRSGAEAARVEGSLCVKAVFKHGDSHGTKNCKKITTDDFGQIRLTLVNESNVAMDEPVSYDVTFESAGEVTRGRYDRFFFDCHTYAIPLDTFMPPIETSCRQIINVFFELPTPEIR